MRLVPFLIFSLSAVQLVDAQAQSELLVTQVGQNGMPRDIVPRQSRWNFGPGSLWTHRGWQYAAYWDDQKQVSVARRQLPDGDWQLFSFPDYQRGDSGDRGKGGRISQGFGDGHEKVAMGISADGHIHLSFDHHVSTLRYRRSKQPIANDPEKFSWSPSLFGPVENNLGGQRLESVTYPQFFRHKDTFLFYLRLGGGSGSGNSHLMSYHDGEWTVSDEDESKIIDRRWSGGDGTVNAYPFGIVCQNDRWHITWCWRETPDVKTSHDICYAYSDDAGHTWRNNVGKIVAKRGQEFITADSPGIRVWEVKAGKRFRNGGSMSVDSKGGVHLIARDENGSSRYFERDPKSGKWSRTAVEQNGSVVAIGDKTLILCSTEGVFHRSIGRDKSFKRLIGYPRDTSKSCRLYLDIRRPLADNVVSVISQEGKSVEVFDYPLPRRLRAR